MERLYPFPCSPLPSGCAASACRWMSGLQAPLSKYTRRTNNFHHSVFTLGSHSNQKWWVHHSLALGKVKATASGPVFYIRHGGVYDDTQGSQGHSSHRFQLLAIFWQAGMFEWLISWFVNVFLKNDTNQQILKHNDMETPRADLDVCCPIMRVSLHTPSLNL